MMGELLGASEGLWLGPEVVGVPVGAPVGIPDGCALGIKVGTALGAKVGAPVHGTSHVQTLTVWMQTLGLMVSPVELVAPQTLVHPRLQSSPAQGSTQATKLHETSEALLHCCPKWS
jgi:hypothetical protein